MRSKIGVVIALLSILAVSDAAMAARTITWVGCGISKLGFFEDLAKAYEKQSGVKFDIQGGGATKGLRQVSSGESNLGGSCRMPLVYRQEDGSYVVEHQEEKVKMIPIGWDALVVIAHKDNNMVKSITRQQLKDVLVGNITNWKQLGANIDKPINLYVRNGSISGVGRTLRQQLFNKQEQAFSSRATYLPSSGKIEKAIEKDMYGIAVSGISSSRHRDVNMIPLEGIEPTMDTLKSGEYMLYRLLFLVAPPDYAKDADLKDFVHFALSAKGSEVIRKAGTLPYRYGLHLLSSGASHEYVQSIDIIDQSGLYSPSGL